MKAILDVKPTSLLAMDPMELMKLLSNEIEYTLLDDIDTDMTRKQAINEMNRLTSYIVYFKEMKVLARNAKRQSKRNHDAKDETDRLLGVEEVFETYEDSSRQLYEQITKMMTMKRLELDEIKLMGKTV
jgi:hypothetical protein